MFNENETLDHYLWKNRISQKDFAAKIGTTTGSICNYINNKYAPSLLAALKIHYATSCKVSLASLLPYKEMQELIEFLTKLKGAK
jgi:transcriptional regulator with XRE-family HTH domain